MPYFIENSEIHYDFNDNLSHFQGVTCELNFKPHQRRRIIKQANQQSKEAFQRFKKQIDPYLEKYILASSEYDKFLDFRYQRRHGSDYKEVLAYWSSLKDIIDGIKSKCFRGFFWTSPSPRYFSSSFHIMKRILVDAYDEKRVIELNDADLLPRRTTQWNTQEKLFTFLLARKSYFFYCFRYLNKYGYNFYSSDNFVLLEEEIRLIIIFLIDNSYVKNSDERALYFLFKGYRRHHGITWLKSKIELAFLIYDLDKDTRMQNRYNFNRTKTVDIITSGFQDKYGLKFNRSTFSQYLNQLNDPASAYSENSKIILIKNFLEHVKTEKRHK